MKIKNLFKYTSNEASRISIGVFICLFSIYLSLNLVTVPKYDFIIYLARAITWLISFFFGGLFSYVFYILLFIFGIIFILKNTHKKIKYGLFLTGAILFSLGGIILISQSILKSADDYSFASFGTNLMNLIVKTESGLKISILKNTGIIGLFVVSCCNNEIISYLIGSILFVSGLILLLIKPCIYFSKKIKEYKNFNYKYAPKESFTKNKDITLTTMSMPTMDDSDDDLNIEETKVETKNIKEVNKDEYISKMNQSYSNEIRVEEKRYNTGINEQIFEGDHFEDKPLTKATYKKDDNNISYSSKPQQNIFENIKQPEINRNTYEEEKSEENNYSSNFSTVYKPAGKEDEKPAFNKRSKRYVAPSISLLENRRTEGSEEENIRVADERSEVINEAFKDLGVKASVVSYKIGPSVTRYDIRTEKNESVKKIDSYINDICIRLGGVDARFSPIVLGKTSSGLEISNAVRSIVNFKDCLIALNKLPKTKPTSIPLGKDINNELLTFDLQEAPHLLVSGTTGSGKSVFLNSIVMSLIMRNSPDDLKLVIIDPKLVEFNRYREIPHLMCPILSLDHGEKISEVLNKLCEIMDERYALFAKTDTVKLKEYNEWAEAHGKEKLPIIVIVIEEYADLVMTNKHISEPVIRIGQKARAAGIHMVIATQKPLVSVINNVLKGNIPTRIALLSASYTDSATIVDQGGAEKLLPNGDMLIKSSLLSNTSLIRCQGSFVDKNEIIAVCDYLRANYGPEYDNEVMDVINKPVAEDTSLLDHAKEAKFNSDEEIYQEVKRWTMGEEFISTSKIQNTFAMGFNRASRIFKRLQAEGVIDMGTAQNSSKGCKVLVHDFSQKKATHEFQGSIEQSDFKKF